LRLHEDSADNPTAIKHDVFNVELFAAGLFRNISGILVPLA